MTDSPLTTLLDLFPAGADQPECLLIPARAIPPPYDQLLVHRHHMTVTVEAFHGSPVDVRILSFCLTDEYYARKILLTKQSDGAVVQFGIARVWLRFCSPPVRAAILAGQTPLGRIMIEHNVLRRIAPIACLEVRPGPGPEAWFGPVGAQRTTYGRLGVIYFDEQPAIEVLEIVAPV
jgi:chorismate-pyruvate lyase